MTEIIRSDGIVLRRRDFGETSRIAVTYTRAIGKAQLLAKGARGIKSKFGAALEPLTRGQFVFYWRESKELFTLKEAAPAVPGDKLRDDPAALGYGLTVAEATDRLTPEGEVDEDGYARLETALAALSAGAPPPLVLTQYLFALAAGLGLAPELDRCGVCRRATGPADLTFSLRDGTATCRQCATTNPDALNLTPPVRRLIKTLEQFPPGLLGRVKADAGTVREAGTFIRAHLRYRTGLELKSLTVTGTV